jgi:hypothetical protein
VIRNLLREMNDLAALIVLGVYNPTDASFQPI